MLIRDRRKGLARRAVVPHTHARCSQVLLMRSFSSISSLNAAAVSASLVEASSTAVATSTVEVDTLGTVLRRVMFRGMSAYAGVMLQTGCVRCPPRETARRDDDARAARAGIVAGEMNEAIVSTIITLSSERLHSFRRKVAGGKHLQGVSKSFEDATTPANCSDNVVDSVILHSVHQVAVSERPPQPSSCACHDIILSPVVMR